MAEARSSIRIRVGLHSDLRLLAAELAEQRNMPVTIASLLEEGIEELFSTSLTEWVAWAKEGRAPVIVNEASVSFRIRSDLSKRLGILAAQLSKESHVPITKIHLTEEAGRRLLVQVRAEQEELRTLLEAVIAQDETPSLSQGDWVQ